MAALKTIHLKPDGKMWLNPKKAPVMFEAFHAIYLYFVAVGKGDINPLLDFIIDGKYDEEFVKHVKPDFFVKPKQDNLFLF